MAGMVARIATTLVSLGYGIVRMQISWPEVFVVSGLGVCYFIAVGALEVSHLANQSDGDVQPPAVWEALVVMTNACFGGWIFLSLELTRKNLAAFGQHGLLYARMDQLPSREPVTPASIARGIELTQRVASASDDENAPPSKAPPSEAGADASTSASTVESL
ncbi:unnamed protein product [Phytophthora fragariaefolia]|uniref:Unnamed protein product n=1 Tax=Phytophthora fragariaefolia TaxID=1490495 RepID=A0A9W6WK75_9STRA|nr:unnamed protein product [Phytophthora fragariaefolia]